MNGAGLSEGVRETLANFLGPQPASVLEVGAGTARLKPSLYDGRRATALAEGCGAEAVAERVIRCAADKLPFGDAVFDRVYCINALHHFTDRARFFAEARRVLKPGGGLMTIGMDPHTDRDEWDAAYAAETGVADRERFARVRTLRGEMALSGFAWTESMEADHVEVVRPAADDPDALRLVADYRLYATVAWV